MHTEIPKAKELEQKVFRIHNEKEFLSIALEIYHFQFIYNPLYQVYSKAVGKTPENVDCLKAIPFLPISFFKTHKVQTTEFDAQSIFKSSGTTGNIASSHYVKNVELYQQSFCNCFQQFYGAVEDYCVLGLLPSYLERGNSSLVYMVDHLIKKSAGEDSGFYLHDFKKLNETLSSLEAAGQKTLLIGVSFALLDFSAAFPQQLQHTIIMETGGMKGRKKETTKIELYDEFKRAFGVNKIHAEYGMTELLSQAYSIEGKFKAPSWMKIFLRDETDPFAFFEVAEKTVSGAINIIDLANLYSCSFIATDDVGTLYTDNSFEVLGRMDNSVIRGCSQLVL
jgi:hypothetical protein